MIYDIKLIMIKSCLLAAFYPYFYFFSKRYAPNFLSLLLFFFFLFICLYLRSRTAFFCVGITYLIFEKQILYKYSTFKLGICFAAVLLAFIAINFHSLLGRLFIWKNIFANKNNFWISGVGIGNFKMIYAEWQSDYFRTHPVWNINYFIADSPGFALNEWLHFWVEFGVFAPIGLSFLVFKNVRWFLKGKNTIVKYCCFSNLTILIFTLISYPLHSIWLLLIIILSHFVIIVSFQKKLLIVCSLFFATIVSVSLNISYNKKSATEIWEEAQMIPISETEEKLKLYEFVNKDLYSNSYFLNDYGIYLINVDLQDSAIALAKKYRKYFNQFELNMLLSSAYIKRQDHNQAIQHLKKANFIIPNRFIPLVTLMELSIELGDMFNAKYYAQKIIDMPVKIPSNITQNIKERAISFLYKYPN